MDVYQVFVCALIHLVIILEVQSNSDHFEYENSWKIFDYNIDGVMYTNDSDYEYKVGTVTFGDEVLEENEKFLIRKNLVPYSIVNLFFDLVVSIPRTKPGIPFTLNKVNAFHFLSSSNEGPGPLIPFPTTKDGKNIISVYDMERDGCRRIYMVDTGFIDIPGVRKQVQEPMVVIINSRYDVVMNKIKIQPEFLRDGVTSGLRTIALDSIYPCSETFMYINDDHSNAVIVFSLKDLSFRRIERPNTREEAWTFPVPKSIVNYMKHVVRYRNLPNETFVQYSKYLQSTIADQEKLRSDADLSEHANPRGVLYERSPNHDVLVFTNEERTHLYCWNVDTPMTEDNIELLLVVSKDNDYYIADFETGLNAFYIIINKVRDFDVNIYDETKTNFVHYKALFSEMLMNTKCKVTTECTNFIDNWSESHKDYQIGEVKYITKYATEEFKEEWEINQNRLWDQL